MSYFDEGNNFKMNIALCDVKAKKFAYILPKLVSMHGF